MCEKGIRETDHLGRANDHGTKEKPAITLTSWLTTIDKHLVATGMDTVFRVLVWKNDHYKEFYLLKEWGNLMKAQVNTWLTNSKFPVCVSLQLIRQHSALA